MPAVPVGLLIKGYLPVRLRFPGGDFDNDEDFNHHQDETFFYIKEHQQQQHGGGGNSTLFVANCPVHPLVSTKLLLKSIFGRYADISRVTVISNPARRKNDNMEQTLERWTHRYSNPSFLHPSVTAPQNGGSVDDGKFAHVEFRFHKEMKEALQALTEIMSSPNNQQHNDNLPAIYIDKIELQTLEDETERPWNANLESLSGIYAVAARYRNSIVDRESLLQECNRVVEEYEESIQAADQEKERRAAYPDEDGFVTVTYGTNDKGTLEASSTPSSSDAIARGRRKATSRSRSKKKNKMGGAAPLPDFYRFQTKESRKRSLHELRHKFEEDLAKVKKMKEERQYRPF